MTSGVPVLVRYINITLEHWEHTSQWMCLSLCLGHKPELSLSCGLTSSVKTIHREMSKLWLEQGLLIPPLAKVLMRLTQITGKKILHIHKFLASETMGINKPYSTEMKRKELLLVTFVELEKDSHNLCLSMASAKAIDKNGCCTIVMFGLELKTSIASSAELLEYNTYLCHWIYSKWI